jgi:putative inorganic carbon (HCO3(-)) transporter
MPFVWGILAVGLGILAATQPASVTAVTMALVLFGLLALITPMAALVVLLVLAPLRALIATESAFQLPLDIGQLALVGLLAVWFAYRIVHRRRLPRAVWSPVLVPVLVFFAAAGLSAFSALSMGAWLIEWLKWAQIVVLVLLCLDLARDQSWEWLVFALVLAGVANALVGLFQFLGGSGALHLLISELEGAHFRAFGTFGQPNPFGGFMGLLAPLALMAALGYAVRGWRLWRAARRFQPSPFGISLFYLIAAGLLAAGVVISWSRGAWLGLSLSLSAMLFALPRRLWHSLVLVAAVGLLAGGLWFSGRLPASITNRIGSAFAETFSTADVRGVDITTENYPLVERLAHWQAAVNMATDHPWLGVGFGNYEAAYPTYRLINWKFPLGHAHNYYLNVLAETGIIGLAAYVVLWLGLFLFVWRTRQHPDPLARCCAVGLFGSWTYLAAHSITDSLYVNNLFLHLGVMIGMLSVLYNQVRRSSVVTRVA